MGLFGRPVGTKVQLGDKIGKITNISAFEIRKAFEITFEDGTKIVRHEVIDKDTDNIPFIVIRELDLLRVQKERNVARDSLRGYEGKFDQLQETIDKQRHRMDQFTEENEQLEAKREELLNEIEAITEIATRDKEALNKEINRHIALHKECKEKLEEMKKDAVQDKGLVERVEEKVKEILDEPDISGIPMDNGADKSSPDSVRLPDLNDISGTWTRLHSPDIDGSDIHRIAPGDLLDIEPKLKVDEDMHLDQEGILKILNDNEEVTTGQIAEACNASINAVMRLCSKMEAKGLVIIGKVPIRGKDDDRLVWLASEQESIEREVESTPDAGTSEESIEPPEDDGDVSISWRDQSRSEVDKEGDD